MSPETISEEIAPKATLTFQHKTFESELLGEAMSNLSRNIDEVRLFALLFNRIPNSILEQKMDILPAIDWFKEEYASEIQADWYRKNRMVPSGQLVVEDNIFILYDDLLVYFDVGHRTIRLLYNTTPTLLVYRLARQIAKFKSFKKLGECRIHFLTTGFGGLKTDSMVLEPVELVSLPKPPCKACY